MQSLSQILRQLLEQESQLLQDVAGKLRACREPLVQGRVDQLAPLLAEQEALTNRLHEVEELRRTVTGQLAKSLGREGEGLTATQLSGLLGQEEGKALWGALQGIKDHVRAVKREREAVNLLVTRHVELLTQTLDAVHEVAHQQAAAPVYSVYGQQQEAAGMSRMSYGA